MQTATIFNHETVVLDGEHFADCEFQDCRMVFNGGGVPVFENCRFIDPGLGHIACTAWPHIRRVHFRNCDFLATSNRGGPFITGGWWEGTIGNCTFIRHMSAPAPDITFAGLGVSMYNITATGGLTLNLSTGRNDENGVNRISDYISVNGWRAYNPTNLFISEITHYNAVNVISLGGSYAVAYP